MIVPEGYHYYIDNLNQYNFQAIIPYSSYNYRVEVLFPVFKEVKQKIELPNIKVSDVSAWVMSLSHLIEDENSQMYNLAYMLIEVAKKALDYEMCGGDEEFTRAVAYYVGHYIEMHLKDLKDEEQKMSINPQSKGEESEEIKKLNLDYDFSMGEYKKTLMGRMFWTVYGQHAKFLVGYAPL